MYAYSCYRWHFVNGWQTAIVPADIKTENLSFIWLAGVGSSPGKASFDLEINGQKALHFGLMALQNSILFGRRIFSKLQKGFD
jgi:hypothetical protein